MFDIIHEMKASKIGLTGEGIVWFLIGWYSNGWYDDEKHFEEDSLLNCTRDELKRAVESSLYIATEGLNLRTDDKPTISGRVRQTYYHFLKLLMSLNKKYIYVPI